MRRYTTLSPLALILLPVGALGTLRIMGSCSSHDTGDECVGRTYVSMPAHFGPRMNPQLSYTARIQIPDEAGARLFGLDGTTLCPLHDTDGRSGKGWKHDGWKGGVAKEAARERSLSSERAPDVSKPRVGKKRGAIVVPPDGSDVAVLVRRGGGCSFHEKALGASVLGHPTSFLIVYDDAIPGSPRYYDEENLIPMGAGPDTTANSAVVSVAAVFVSGNTGGDLRARIGSESSHLVTMGGHRIYLDASNQPFFEDPSAWMIAGVGSLLMILLISGTLLLCVHTGYVRMEGNVVILGFSENPAEEEDDGRLTREEVMALPEVWFKEKTAPGSLDRAVTVTAASDKTATACAEDAVEHTGFDCFETVTSCSICLDDFEATRSLRLLHCGHAFHTECILPWLVDRQGCCPLCKAPAKPGGDNDDGINNLEDSIDNNESAEEGNDGRQPSQNEYAEEVNGNYAEVAEHGGLGSLLNSIFGRWQSGHGAVPSPSRPHPLMDALISSPPSA
eukprot:CAMPEP_0194265560 /NCGR_PEP_ID=MMETSP0169-20130528/758_1 /TAXON_ID=218684 /ORGANISM="Corethron pennatum, Strain L29A3" /LENGTH=504 /DNA_ID=CAMNT_0039006047 /DNA_START=63 /DNA_END=1577 /DNA_ORIENTATION=+